MEPGRLSVRAKYPLSSHRDSNSSQRTERPVVDASPFRLFSAFGGSFVLRNLTSGLKGKGQRDKDQRDDPRRLRAKRIIPDPSINIMHEGSGTLATRKPMLVAEIDGGSQVLSEERRLRKSLR